MTFKCPECGETLGANLMENLVLHVCDSRKLAEKIQTDLCGPSSEARGQDGDTQ